MQRDESDDETSEHEKSEPKSRAPKGNYKATAGQIRNSSITVGPTTIPSICGPISEWLPIPENLPNHPTMAFFGKRRTGKSTTITNIAAACCQHIPFGLVMSDTAYAGYWEQIVPKRHIVQGEISFAFYFLSHMPSYRGGAPAAPLAWRSRRSRKSCSSL